jgi:hypothetical protein
LRTDDDDDDEDDDDDDDDDDDGEFENSDDEFDEPVRVRTQDLPTQVRLSQNACKTLEKPLKVEGLKRLSNAGCLDYYMIALSKMAAQTSDDGTLAALIVDLGYGECKFGMSGEAEPSRLPCRSEVRRDLITVSSRAVHLYL